MTIRLRQSSFLGVCVWMLAGVCVCATAQDPSQAAANDEQPTFSIAIHGGAGGNPGAWSDDYKAQRKASLTRAIEQGVALLQAGEPALDVVEAVIRGMEDDEVFNAGRGCVLNEQGEHELDASIMDGASLACGAVASLKTTRHPISLARKVMTDTKHVLLMGSGADLFGQQLGLEQALPEHFQTASQREKWQRWKSAQTDLTSRERLGSSPSDQAYFGTVGCVVLDRQGNLAAGTSTGGLMGKRWGRVGDSPIIGAGNYADNKTCAVSGTGVGEEFIRHSVASDIAARMRYANKPLAEATQATIGILPENCGGVIAVDRAGNIAVEFNTVGMSYATADAVGSLTVKLSREE